MVTIDDVAKRAGVSRTTVSRVINNNGYVKAETLDKVQQAIAELNYRPNIAARGLVTNRRMNTIAHIMIDIDDMIHVMVNKGIEEACYKRGYSTIVCDANTKDRENDYINMIIDKSIGGAIFHHLDIKSEQVELMHSAGVKCVLIDNEKEIPLVPNICTNDYLGGYLAAQHLIERGHTKLGCMFGVMSEPKPVDGTVEYIDTFQYNIWKQRTRGFYNGMKAHGLKINKDFFYQGDGTMKHGLKKANEIMTKVLSSKDRPTAIYCENDVMALGALNAALKLKLDIPQEIAIMGHDGLFIVDAFYPRLTTIVQPQYQMGYLAANIVMDLIEGKKSARKHEKIILEPRLAIGETT